jgi:hypothetical protein
MRSNFSVLRPGSEKFSEGTAVSILFSVAYDAIPVSNYFSLRAFLYARIDIRPFGNYGDSSIPRQPSRRGIDCRGKV